MPILADEIADLLNPTPSADADADELHADYAGARAVVDPGLPQPSAEGMPRRRMRAALELEGADAVKYAGRRISREKLHQRQSLRVRSSDPDRLEDADEDGGDEEEEGEEAEAGEEGEDDDASELEGEEDEEWDDSDEDGDRYEDVSEDGSESGTGRDAVADEQVTRSALLRRKRRVQAEDHDDDDDDDDDEGDGEGDDDELGFGEDAGAEAGSLFERWEAIQAQEAELAAQLNESRSREVQQAQEAKKQHTLWLQLVQLRIKMQPAMAAAAKWPAASESALWGLNEPLRAASSTAASEVAELLTELCTLRDALLSSFQSGSGDKARAKIRTGRKEAQAWQGIGGDPDAWWPALEEADERARPLVEKWVGESSAAAQGGSSLRADKQFTTVRQGVLQQVEHMLGQIPLGSTLREERCHQATEAVLGVGKPGVQTETAVARQGAQVYNDTDFYHALLREILEDGSESLPSAISAPKLKHKKRKTDNRQSKGRKLSYEVQPLLQNFMFPVIPERPVVLSELFSSVFGRRTRSAAIDIEPARGVERGAARNGGVEEIVLDSNSNLFLTGT